MQKRLQLAQGWSFREQVLAASLFLQRSAWETVWLVCEQSWLESGPTVFKRHGLKVQKVGGEQAQASSRDFFF